MNVSFNCSNLRSKPALCGGKTKRSVLFLRHNLYGEFRVFDKKRRRLKRCPQLRSLVVVNSSLFDGSLPFDSLTSAVVGVTSGLTIYISSRFFGKSSANSVGRVASGGAAGEWILFTSPTPFNRFVLLRCPSISFDVGDGELLESVNDRLVNEDRYFVRLDAGKIPAMERNDDDDEVERDLEYQRVCVSTEDGGVLSLDWPASLDLGEERGLDTTVFLVPGTPEGSMDRSVRSFVYEALRRGLFPVVMNPRGCAGSPLTTARLFTAADSDDILAAIQFITKARPWTTLMGVGWGYGANMLTKYLAEVGEKTPLTAAACIDNPFDLEEVTRSFPYHNALDQQLAGGLVDILRSNKELFQGRAKRFDVKKALLSKSVRDFEKAISMVTYGFETIEDFYLKSSTRSVVGNIKIPVLFIQNDDGIVPLFSIPRGSIAENPFTSLLLCSLTPSSATDGGGTAVSWCNSLTIEWLTAVELGLLKGRHPLLKDVDVTFNPSRGLALVERSASDKGAKVKGFLELTRSNAINDRPIGPTTGMVEDNDTSTRFHLQSRQESEKNDKINTESHGLENAAIPQTKSVEAEIVDENESNTEDIERGQIVQTAQVVMNMLDVTMPGTLKDEEKKKVLAAVDQGETIVKALQDAVPEDVRGKLTAAVSGILHTQGTKLKFDRPNFPNVSPEFKPKAQEPVKGPSIAAGYKDSHSSDQMKNYDDSVNIPDNFHCSMNGPAVGTGSELHSSETSQKSGDSGQHQPMNSHQDGISGLARKGSDEAGIDHENNESSTKETAAPSSETGINHEYHESSVNEKVAQSSDSGEKVSESGPKFGITSQGKTSGTWDATVDKADQDASIARQEKEENVQKNEDRTHDSSGEQNKMASTNTEEGPRTSPGSSSEPQPKAGNDNQKKETKSTQPVPEKPVTPESNHPTFSVSQALDALSGIDDSTQVAVNSVFGVLENMISQLEEGKNGENVGNGETKAKDGKINSAFHEHPPDKKEADENSQLLRSHDPFVYSSSENKRDSHRDMKTGWMKEEHLVGKKFLANNFDRNVNDKLSYTPNPDENSLHHGYFQGDFSEVPEVPSTNQLDLDMTTALFLDYYPEEGQWKLLEQEQPPENFGESVGGLATSWEVGGDVQAQSHTKAANNDNFIEPSYVILDTEQDHKPVEGYDTMDNKIEDLEKVDQRSEELMRFIKAIILDSLQVEVQRRINSSDVEKTKPQLSVDIEKVANAVSFAVERNAELTCGFECKNYNSQTNAEKVGILQGETIIRAISSAVQDSRYLRRVLPVGVIVGSGLAALRKYFHVSTIHNDGKRASTTGEPVKHEKRDNETNGVMGKENHKNRLTSSKIRRVETGSQNINNDSVMVGAVTAALGASALLVQQQDPQKDGQGNVIPSRSGEKGSRQKDSDKLEELISGKNQSNIVNCLAEKAMSVAGPMVPTKEDGEVDHERLVAMLADLGQKGGILKLVGKIALLWGGLRGAMSLTDRLILFLHIAERPLLQRVLGFVGMVLVLWSPVVVPLLPTLVQSWSTQNPSRMAELACIIGLYSAVLILVMLWGKRIRGYQNPLRQYGLEIISLSREKIQDFVKGLAGGITLVFLIQSLNAVIGVASFSWPTNLSSSDPISWLRGYGHLLLLTVRGIIAATGVVVVEELLFRSWLPEEIATDLGYHQGIVISGLAFSLFQRSLIAIPGLWLLSLALAGARQRSRGSLSVPIGLRMGIMASSFVLQMGHFLTYNSNVPVWITGASPLQPLSGMVGLSFSFALAFILYPRQPLETMKYKKS